MAFTKCGACNKSISDKATVCPHCGVRTSQPSTDSYKYLPNGDCEILCPQCRQWSTVNKDRLKNIIQCPKCKSRLDLLEILKGNGSEKIEGGATDSHLSQKTSGNVGVSRNVVAASNKNDLICNNCGFRGAPKNLVKGGCLTEGLLWLLFIVPGLIYSIWRLTTKAKVCPMCGAPNMIPVDSPRGRQLAGAQGK